MIRQILLFGCLCVLEGCARTFSLAPIEAGSSYPTGIAAADVEIVDNTSDQFSFSTMSLTIENKKEALKRTILSELADGASRGGNGSKVLATIDRFDVDFSMGVYHCRIGADFVVVVDGSRVFSRRVEGAGSAFNMWPNSYEDAINQAFRQFAGAVPVQEIALGAAGRPDKPARAVSLSGTGASRAGSPGRKDYVAFMDLQSNGVDPSVSRTLTDLLVNSVQAKGCYHVMERSQMDKILKEQGFQQSGACSAAECAVEIGKLLSINKMVVGSIGKLGNSYILNLRRIDIQSGEVEANSSQQIHGGIENSAQAIGTMADDLCR